MTKPTNHEIIQPANTERRSIGRTQINRDASLYFASAGTFPCCVRDVTNSGAGVRLEIMHLLPVEFDLSFDNFRTTRKCQLVWRDGDVIGVAFRP